MYHIDSSEYFSVFKLPSITEPLVKVQYIQGNGKAFFEAVCKQGLEGSVQKLANSKYRPGRRDYAWLKVINYSFADVWITGYRKREFGWILAFEDGRPAGIIVLGVPIEARKFVYEISGKLIIKETKDFVYINPLALKCQVRYRNLTKAKLLRIPSFVRFVA